MNALSIGYQTTVGAFGTPPVQHGNCFGLNCEDGREYRIVNFYVENLEALLSLGLTWPVQVKVLAGHIAIVHDPRIGERWYSDRYCEVCCPKPFLPITQLQRHEREVMRGVRAEGERHTRIVIGSHENGAEFP